MSQIDMSSPTPVPLPNADFWAGRRVFLSGHTSFLGAWAAIWLERLGATVMGFALPPKQMLSLYEQGRVAAALASHFVDLRDRDMMEELVEPTGFDIVLHMAPRNLADIDARMLPAAVMRNLQAFVLVIEGEDQSDVPASSDAAALAANGPPRAHVHLGSLVGGGDYGAESLIPSILRAYDAQTNFPLQDPDRPEPWQHVLDGLSGLFAYVERLVTRGDTARSLDFIGGDGDAPMSRGAFASTVQKALNADYPWLGIEKGAGASDLATKGTPPPGVTFTNRLNDRRAIAWALHWYLLLSRGADMKAVCLSQIAAYERGFFLKRPDYRVSAAAMLSWPLRRQGF